MDDSFIQQRSNALRSLARDLVRDPFGGEDLVQDAWLQATLAGKKSPPWSWFRTVLGRLAGAQRESADAARRREKRVARGERLPSAADVAAQHELLKILGDAVARLPEKLRTTVVLRFFYDLPPREIACRGDLPVRRVQKRLQRALERLRADMDAAAGPRESWRGSFGALLSGAALRPELGASTLAGGLIMGTKAKLAFLSAVVLTLLVGGTWVLLERAPSEARRLHRESEEASPPGASSTKDPSMTSVPYREGAPFADGDAGRGRRERPDPKGVVEGRVVDGQRRPVPGATVEIRSHLPLAPPATTDALGRFRIGVTRESLDAAEELTVDARHPTAGVALRRVTRPDPRHVGVGTLSLAPGSALTVVVTHEGSHVLGASVSLAGFQPLGGGHVGSVRTDSRGRASWPALPRGVYRLRALTATGLAGTSSVVLPEMAGSVMPLRLVLGNTVGLLVTSGDPPRPHAGARVTVWEHLGGSADSTRASLPLSADLFGESTDGAGRMVFQGLLPEAHLVFRVNALGFRPVSLESNRRDLAEVTVQLEPATDSRVFLLRAGSRPPPPDGTDVLILKELPGAQGRAAVGQARVQEGHLSLADFPSDSRGDLVAKAPDGSEAVLRVRGGEPEPAVFEAPRKLEIRLRTAGGVGVPGIVIEARGQGGSALRRRGATDGEGVVSFDDLHTDSVVVEAIPDTPDANALHLGSVILRQELTVLEAPFELPRELELTVRQEQVPKLPKTYTLELLGGVPAHLEEDADQGVIRARYWPSWGSVQGGTLTAPGFAPAHFPLETGGDPSRTRRSVDLTRGLALEVKVEPPGDGSFRLRVDREEEGVWAPCLRAQEHVVRLSEPGTTPLHLRFEGLGSGRHRVRDALSGAFEVIQLPGTDVASLDLSLGGWVEGRVEASPAKDLAAARIVVTGVGVAQFVEGYPDGAGRRLPLLTEGRFRIRIPGKRPVELSAWHPELAPAPTGGSQVFTQAATDVRLLLERASTLEIPLAFDPPLGGASGPVEIHVFAATSRTDPVRVAAGGLEDDAQRIGGLAPGTYDLWIDAFGYAPRWIEGLAVSPGSNLVPAVPLVHGSSLRVRLQGSGPTPAFEVTVVPSEGRRYVRSTDNLDDRAHELVVSGLAAGPHRVELVEFTLAGPRRSHHTIESPKTGETSLVIDLARR